MSLSNIHMRNSFCSSKAKIFEKMEFTNVNEYFENLFNAAGAKNMNHVEIT